MALRNTIGRLKKEREREGRERQHFIFLELAWLEVSRALQNLTGVPSLPKAREFGGNFRQMAAKHACSWGKIMVKNIVFPSSPCPWACLPAYNISYCGAGWRRKGQNQLPRWCVNKVGAWTRKPNTGFLALLRGIFPRFGRGFRRFRFRNS